MKTRNTPCMVGRTEKGNAWVPWLINSVQDYVEHFGPISEAFPLSKRMEEWFFTNGSQPLVVFHITDGHEDTILEAAGVLNSREDLQLAWTEYPALLEAHQVTLTRELGGAQQQTEELALTHEDALARLKARNEEVERLKEDLSREQALHRGTREMFIQEKRLREESLEELTGIRRVLDAADVDAYSADNEMPPSAELPLDERIRRAISLPQRSWAVYETIQHALNRSYFGAPFDKPENQEETLALRQKAYDALDSIFHPSRKVAPPEVRELVEQLKARTQEAERKMEMAEARQRDAEGKAAEWESTLNMYANAWRRELGGRLSPKRHEIDALVKTTRELRESGDIAGRAVARIRNILHAHFLPKLQAALDGLPGQNPTEGADLLLPISFTVEAVEKLAEVIKDPLPKTLFSEAIAPFMDLAASIPDAMLGTVPIAGLPPGAVQEDGTERVTLTVEDFRRLQRIVV
jgi:hypothetical protein